MARRPGSHLRDASEIAGGVDPGLPEDCPVVPLGIKEDGCFYLDAANKVVFIKSRDHGNLRLLHLFGGRRDYLSQTPGWQRFDRKGQISGPAPELIAASLMAASARRGLWDDVGNVRGRGAWKGADGDLVLHCGDVLWIDGQVVRPGLREDLVYQASPPRPRPAHQPQPDGDDGPAAELRTLLKCWPWADATAAHLLLGWCCAAMVGGALDWRPACWLTGDKGTGKSTLQDLLRWLFVQGRGIQSLADTTAAGLRQLQVYDSIPVGLDELEAHENTAKVDQVIELLRLAASGGLIVRGGADHKGQSFRAQFCTLASSILVPSLRPQDRSRIAVLELRELDAAARAPRLEADTLQQLGRKLLRRMADRWPHLPDRLATWRESLMHGDQRFDARGADQYGTLLACADLALHDAEPDGDTLAEWCDRVRAFTAQARAAELSDWQSCLIHLTSTIAAAWRNGEQRTIGSFVAQAAGQLPGKDDVDEANNILATVGLRVVVQEERAWLAVANQHAGLNKVFREGNTHWVGRSGGDGVWNQSLRRATGARTTGPMSFRGVGARAVLVPVDVVLNATDARR